MVSLFLSFSPLNHVFPPADHTFIASSWSAFCLPVQTRRKAICKALFSFSFLLLPYFHPPVETSTPPGITCFFSCASVQRVAILFFFFFMQGMFCREKQIDAAASGQQKETKDSRPSRCRTPPAKSWESQPNPTTSLKMYAHGAGSSRPQYLYGCQAKQASMSASLSPTVPSRGELAGWLAGSLARRTGGKSGRDFEERRIACLPSPPPALAEITWCRRRIIRDILRSGDEIIIPRPVLARAHCGTGQVGSLRRGGGLVAGSGVRM